MNIGAKVMITVNDLGGKYVNGTMGGIKNFHTEKERDNEYLEIMTDKGKRIRIYRYAKDIEKQVIEEEKM